MERSRWIALVIVGLYIALDLLVIAPRFQLNGQEESGPFPGQRAGSFLALIAFACIWWPDILGGGFMLRAVMVESRSGGAVPDWLAVIVRLLGWGLLVVAIKLRFDLISPP